jgi:hypothetical protein
LIFKKRSAGVGFFENTNLFPHDPMLKNWWRFLNDYHIRWSLEPLLQKTPTSKSIVGVSLPSVNTAMSASLSALGVPDAYDPNSYITWFDGNLAIISGRRWLRRFFIDICSKFTRVI